MRCDHGMQCKRNFPFLLSVTSENQTSASAVAAPKCPATCTSALALATGKPYKYAWSDLLGDSTLVAGVNFVFIHSYSWENSVILKVFSNLNNSLILRPSAVVKICIGKNRCFFHVSAIEADTKCCSSHLQPRVLWKFGNSRFSCSRSVQGVRRWDHAGFDTRLSCSRPVEHLLSVILSFKAKYVLQGKYITLDLGSFPSNTLCLGWRCLCQWWISQCKRECVVQLEADFQEQIDLAILRI